MKKILLITALLFSGSVFAGNFCQVDGENVASFPHANGKSKRSLCHHTSSDTNPYVKVCSDAKSNNGHFDASGNIAHGGDFIPTAEQLAYNTCGEVDTSTPPVTPCPNCPTGTSGEASYDLEIEMGGFKDGLYVCEVGFNAHKCAAKNRNPKGDHIVVGSEIITVESGAKTFSAEEAITAGSAKVYLNSSNYGAAYYVKYCYDYTKVVVGDAAHLATLDLEGDFYGNVTLDIADGGGYYSHAGVEGNVTVTCGGVVEATPISLDSNLEQSVPFSHLFDLNGPVNTSLQNGCTFEIEFSETMRDYVRQLKDDNSTYSATISTGVKFWMDLLY